ncbi:MAG: dethiobiotin synthase [Bacteroidia bacterium]|nr:dethiobiotin synthase [Bacteroidia bacterium]
MADYVIAGIGTGVGKTLVSAILTEALEADYWKPIQAGDLESSDTITVKHLVSNSSSFFHPESYRLKTPMSPHAAADIDNIYIDPEKIVPPETNKRLLIELAGGLMVPLNKDCLNIDLLEKWKIPVILVSQNYLGSINHTLLSCDLLRSRSIPVHGLIFNGPENKSSEDFILNYTKLTCIARIPELKIVNNEIVRTVASKINLDLFR